jgi:hypothetical protein
MILAKKDSSGKIVTFYEIFGYRVDIDSKNVSVSMTKYTMQPNGVPYAEDFIYVLSDHMDVEEVETTQEILQPERDSNGNILYDANGNPIEKRVVQSIKSAKEVYIESYTDFLKTKNGNLCIIDASKKCIFECFQKYKLKDPSFKIEYV